MAGPKTDILNGGWLIRILLGSAILWGGWITVETLANRSARLKGDRFTTIDAQRMEMRQQAALASEVKSLVMTISSLPPVDWRSRIEKLETKIDILEANQIKMIAIMERSDP